MRINVAALKRAVGDSEHFTLEEQLSSLDLKDGKVIFLEPVKVSLKVTNVGNYLHASGTISCTADLNCGRCLESYSYPLTTQFEEKYYVAEVGLKDVENQDEEYIPFSKDAIDITNEVVAAIQLSLPMRQICSEGCKGLCSHCGTNLNNGQCNCQEDDIDPRMAVLKDLFKKK